MVCLVSSFPVCVLLALVLAFPSLLGLFFAIDCCFGVCLRFLFAMMFDAMIFVMLQGGANTIEETGYGEVSTWKRFFLTELR